MVMELPSNDDQEEDLMMDEYVWPSKMVVDAPPPPTWAWSFDPSFAIRFNVPRHPNRFHRFMQRVLLGIHWRNFE
jgi:hypothetical protein